jgi:lycopene cyclase domain-containing protein
MGYPFLAISIVVFVLVVDLLLLRTCILFKRNTWVVFIILVMVTIIFDSVIVSTIVSYNSQTLSGIFVGRIPVEDFSYTFAAVVLPISIKKYYERI